MDSKAPQYARLHPFTRAVYEFVRDYIQLKRIPPTIREIGEGVYLGHSTVWAHLNKLEGMGWLERDMGIPRSLRLGEYAPDAPHKKAE